MFLLILKSTSYHPLDEDINFSVDRAVDNYVGNYHSCLSDLNFHLIAQSISTNIYNNFKYIENMS